MNILKKLSGQIFTELKKAQNILIISHRNPDADCIGSNLGLRLFLEKSGKNVTSACIDKIPAGFEFLPNYDSFTNHFRLQNFDLIISVDVGSTAQLGFDKTVPELLNKTLPFINIDHHPSNNNFGTLNLIQENKASTTLILYLLFEDWKIKISPDIATCLLYGLYYDTGSFMHSNTTNEVYEVASKLLLAGANNKLIVQNLYKNRSIQQLMVWGKILSDAKLTSHNILVSGILEKDITDCKASTDTISGIIDYLSMIQEARFAVLMHEDGKGNIKGSFRTRSNNVDLSQLASIFGGGGHKKASGFSVQGKLGKKLYWNIDTT